MFCGRHLLAAKLRRANIDAAAGAVGEVARIVSPLRRRWPGLQVLLRAGPQPLAHTRLAVATGATPRKETAPVTAQTLPDEPDFCFVPACDVVTEVQQIRIVIGGLAGHVPTALIALHLDDALTICDKLNKRLGLTREQWTALAARSMHAETPEPGAEH